MIEQKWKCWKQWSWFKFVIKRRDEGWMYKVCLKPNPCLSWSSSSEQSIPLLSSELQLRRKSRELKFVGNSKSHRYHLSWNFQFDSNVFEVTFGLSRFVSFLGQDFTKLKLLEEESRLRGVSRSMFSRNV